MEEKRQDFPVTVQGLHKSFGSNALLRGIDFSVQAGECIAIVGPGGCGKSILFKILMGLEKFDSGDVQVLGKNIAELSEPELLKLRRVFGVAFQQGALFDSLTVRQNIRFAMDHMTEHSVDKKEALIKELIEGVKLGHALDLYPHELSGGMQRRVGIARALAVEPELAFFDEPTAGLDPVTSTVILNMIHELGSATETKPTLLVATSNVEIAIRFAERILVMHEGKIVADGAWQELLVSGSDWVQNFLGARLIGLDIDYARGLNLPQAFLEKHFSYSQ